LTDFGKKKKDGEKIIFIN